MSRAKTHFARIAAQLEAANSVRGALFVLKTQLAEFHDSHLAYEYMIARNAFIRGDLVTMTTLPKENTDKYWASGGTNSDPVIENAGSIHDPLFVDLEKLCANRRSKFYKNEFFLSLAGVNCKNLAAYPFLEDGDVGYGVLTVFANSEFMDGRLEPDHYKAIGRLFYDSLKRNGQVLRYFDMTKAEIEVLRLAARGKSTGDIAGTMDVSRRLIELRLQTARKKLHARTTAEAVYKAAVHRLIP